MKASRYLVVAMLIAGTWTGIAAGRWARPDYLPADRLIENATAYVQEHPTDASGYYTLARIHYLAFVDRSFLVGAFGVGASVHPIEFWWGERYLEDTRLQEAQRLALVEFGYASIDRVPSAKWQEFSARVWAIEGELEAKHWEPPQPTEEQLVGHAGAAQWNFYKAIALDPNNALYYLGQASLGEQYLEYFGEKSPAPMPAMISALMLGGIKQIYLQAYEVALDEDLALKRLPLEGLRGLISHEAGAAYVRLWEAESQIPADVQETLKTIKANLKTLEALPRGAVTPIVFSMEAGLSLADLLAPEKSVRFDLDGDGIIEERPWIKPTTGLLAWDIDRDGRITSGRELFGSVTGWLFFPNGYRAMDMLDDNRDGLLTIGELKGLCAWFDRDSDGQSDDGEVVSVESLGITAISTRPTGHEGQSPMHSAGIRFKDGRTVPTYDWIAPSMNRSQKMLLR